MFDMAKKVLRQLFRKPATNEFPARHTLDNAAELLEKAGKSGAKINPPIKTPKGFRGRMAYERDKCIKCKQCIRVCPTGALEIDEKDGKIKHHVARCCFCSQCTDICPVKCLHMTGEFLISSYDKKMGFVELKTGPKEENPGEKK